MPEKCLFSYNRIKNVSTQYLYERNQSFVVVMVVVSSQTIDVFYSILYGRRISRGELERVRGISVFLPREKCRMCLRGTVRNPSEAKVRHCF